MIMKANKYYVSDHARNGLLLHREGCTQLPSIEARVFIGSCYSRKQALTVAQGQYQQVQYCPRCMVEPQATSFEPVNIPVLSLGQAVKPKSPKKAKILMPVRHFPV